MTRKQIKTMLPVIGLGCLLVQGILQVIPGGIHDRWVRDYAPKGQEAIAGGLDPQQFLFALAGFREMIAGILWVRADSFFDTGNYDAILPLIRLVTVLDPNEIDVYATGMWHIGYNFTDQEERSDRRYIASALALGKEGIKNNKNTYEMYFETGWMWFNKIDDDYDKAPYYFEQAVSKPDIQPARKNLLTNALIRDGKLKEAMAEYYQLYDDATKSYDEDKSFANNQNRTTIENNLDNLIVRMTQRGYFAGDKKDGFVYDTEPPHNVNFSVKASIIDQRVLRVEGAYDVLPVGTRIRIVLRDRDVAGNKIAELDWDGSTTVNLDPDKDLTFMQDQLYVKNRRFNKRFDLTTDPTMYPFAKDNYVLEFYYNPRSAPAHMQDKFGYLGEGYTDSHFLRTDVRPGQRVLYCKFDVSKDQVYRRGEWQDKVPTFKTDNYVDPSSSETKDDVIFVPTLRAGGK